MPGVGYMDGDGDGLRERRPVKRQDTDSNSNGGREPQQEKKEKTFGRTPDGTVFVVPQTHDMVSQLLSPSQPKNFSDVIVLAVLGIHILTLYFLPASLRIPVFTVVFLFWRACYNAGVGYLLHVQSRHWRLVAWAKKSRIFVNPKTGDNPHPVLYHFLKREMETKIPEDYKFEDAPVEYNTWLVFRRVVDLILMCDFVSYMLFAMACGSRPASEGIFLTTMRWITGIGLFFFNLWVKLDAHRVVKDYAWYWGDFFYLIDQELTFDGVFEMAPHPMYSVGYAGYYGISLMAASYKVLFISIIAHAAQFAFLIWVENPHIEKTYNPPPSRRQLSESEPSEMEHSDGHLTETDHVYNAPPLASPTQPSPVHNLIGLNNIDLHRVTDSSVILLQIYIFALVVLTPSTPFYQALFVTNAVLWRLWYSMGVGYLLNRQSTKKRWTRHFLKYGESTEEAWRQWKGTYHLAMVLCYASFVAASWKMYSLPHDWVHGMVLLRHVVGVSLVALQIWTSISIYGSLGEFGWFFGDFFFDHSPKLTYSGIYRFLNNPERVIGLAGVWGAALITGSRAIFCLALLSHVLTLSFIQLVERPHMQKLYGRSLRRESGLVKSLKRSLPPHLWQWQGSVDKMLEGTLDSLEDFVDAARPKIAAGVNLLVKDSTALLKRPRRLSITRIAPDLAGYDPNEYSIEIEGTRSVSSGTSINGKSTPPRSEQRSDFKPVILEYGAPIKVRWTAPLNHSKMDWVGLYMVSDNASREVTRVSSQGRWVATNNDQFGSIIADRGILLSDTRVSGAIRKDGKNRDYLSGEMKFSGDKLWWTTGVFEFRYHHNGKHNVMAVSVPFETRINKFDEDDVETDANGSIRGPVEEALLQLVRNCFDRDPDIAPSTVDESFGGLVERDGKFARRVVYAVHQMFGIEFAPEVVQADGNVRNLSWRVCNAKKVLEPYMSLSHGKNTPTESRY
ncbi:phosphatidylethanolamine N-methyltransferase [Lepraria neglecta]|uniref:Phosphatidylethanolamine N-methyltransferase n=1 Tax=Lepraria neglecta TaxID=209136 RepID=A0AAD9ZBP1_9LECA|nr:phosphatidylethanolamine N-methyltransferase [Lepraria neglecta]